MSLRPFQNHCKRPYHHRGLVTLAVVLASVFAVAVSGCRVHVDKDSEGKEKKVQIDTPFGGVHVNTDQTTAGDLGLPVYPGARPANDDKHKSADVHVGFGQWQVRVKAVSYTTPDDQDKVTAFYKKALARYGDVLTCQGNTPVGAPIATREGLTCADNDGDGKVKIDDMQSDIRSGLQLKAGSKRHQHIIGFDKKTSGQTEFALIALDLPGNIGKDDDDQKQ